MTAAFDASRIPEKKRNEKIDFSTKNLLIILPISDTI